VEAAEIRLRRELTEDEMDAVFGTWYAKATGYLLEGQTRDTYRLEFMKAYEDVKFPLGEGILSAAWQDAQVHAPPKAALRFDDPRIRQVVSLTRELQKRAGADPFYLSCRTVQRLLALPTHTQANGWLRGLSNRKWGILTVVDKGSKVKARRFRYRPPLTE
jgi:hypothetical protein